MFTTTFLPSPIPKITKNEFEAIGNFFIVRQGGQFHYFPVKVAKHPPNAPTPILRFEKLPPVLMEGWVVTQRRIYLVSVQDLLRGIVRTSNEFKLEKEDGRNKSNPAVRTTGAPETIEVDGTSESGTKARSAGSTSTDGPFKISATTSADKALHLLEPGSIEVTGLEIDAAANRAMLEQIDALRSAEDD